MDERGLLLGSDGDLVIRSGTLLVGATYTQEVELLLKTCKGEWRHDPLAGCDLVRRTNSRITRTALQRLLKTQLERDGKVLRDVKAGVNIMSHG